MNVMNTGRLGGLVPDSVLLFALWMMGVVVRMYCQDSSYFPGHVDIKCSSYCEGGRTFRTSYSS